MTPGDATTPEDCAAEAAIAAIPAWMGATIRYRRSGAAIVSPMHKGVESDCFAVDVDGQFFFLKIIHPDCRDTIVVADAFAAASIAADAGVAPRALHCVPEAHALVFERLDSPWRTARVDDLHRASVMTGVLDAKKAIQAGPRLRRSWSVFAAVRAFDAVAAGAVAADLWWMLDAVRDIETAIAAAGHAIAPCHADGLASNIMIGQDDSIRLVDFDMAANTDPLYDLGILLNEAYDFEDDMRPALEHWEGAVRETTLNRCRLYAIADDLYWGLWASRLHATSQRRGLEFLKYAQWRFLRCRMALRDPGFERRLRRI